MFEPDPMPARLLLSWYDAFARDLPWRTPPGSKARPDPYRVWLSEIMLQQTTVAAVRPYFGQFTARWPDVDALAAADDDAVMAAWAGLGYYARARNLLACARAVSLRGGFPDTEEGLRALPGVGAYTAAAIAAIAFGRRAVVVDANVERVVSRLFAITEPLPKSRPTIRAATDAITPDMRAGDFAQAMMDLGATICTPKGPDCPGCPLNAGCLGREQGVAAELPRKLPKKPRPDRRGTAFAAVHDGDVLLVRRAGREMLGGMWALPDDGWAAGRDGDGMAPFPADWTRADGTVDHGFTHFALSLSVMRTELATRRNLPEGQWWPLDRIAEAGLPTLFAKAVRLALCDTAD